MFPRWPGWAGASIAAAAILGSAAIVENGLAGVFATVNSLAWLAYFLWTAALAVSLMLARDIPSEDVVLTSESPGEGTQDSRRLPSD